MGTAYSFECPSCGYSAEVCGGTDSGFGVTLRTSTCADCNAIVDVIIGGPRFLGGKPSEMDNPNVGRCSKCEGKSVKPWKRSRPCPKCQSGMKKGNKLIMWD
jgi:hypothetical protein